MKISKGLDSVETQGLFFFENTDARDDNRPYYGGDSKLFIS